MATSWEYYMAELPYAPDVKELVRQHLRNLTFEFPSMEATLATYNDVNGNEYDKNPVVLLQAEGSIPVENDDDDGQNDDDNDSVYNYSDEAASSSWSSSFSAASFLTSPSTSTTWSYIPIIIWLPAAYPRAPPVVVVVCPANPVDSQTRHLAIKQAHKYVDAISGEMSVPYLRSWAFSRGSNLVGLARAIATAFSIYPPFVYINKNSSSSSRNPNSSSQELDTYPEAGSSNSTELDFYVELQRSLSISSADTSSMNELLERLTMDTSAIEHSFQSAIDELVSTESLLEQRQQQLRRGLEDLRLEKEQLQNQLLGLCQNSEVLENWIELSACASDVRSLRRMTHDDGEDDDVIDHVFEATDPLSKKLLECQCHDLALDDALYYLDQYFHACPYPLDDYLKHVRGLARLQFHQRKEIVSIEHHHRMQLLQPSLRG